MPSKNKLVYLSPAAEDLNEIVNYHLYEAGLESAQRIYHKMKTEISKLIDYPFLGQLHPDPLLASQNYRKLVLTSTYVAIYKIINSTIYVYRIVNGRTDYPKLLR
ncbi:MAG: type II toxin-antitoxin system RelE/ParE family toxin [Anaerolineaceae bacterium]|nr:type II toxin-antitoxin system RelE/ParE family toxin [Anaerolineaceae bacterium]